jgi:hypothetical protein
LYDRDKMHFLIEPLDPIDASSPHDLPRNSQGTALLADPRNDSNVIIGQLTLAFLKYHNHVVDQLGSSKANPMDRFLSAQQHVRWHYQWIVLHEYLPRLVGPDVVQAVITGGRKFYRPSDGPCIPAEFSAAAFRFGHSQIRARYRLNEWPYAAEFDLTRKPFMDLPIFKSRAGANNLDIRDLSGGIREPGRFVEWDRFFDLGKFTDRDRHLQLSKRIDTKLASALFDLPGPVLDGLQDRRPTAITQRDLLRQLSFSLPSGQAIARAMQDKLHDTEIKVLDAHDLPELGRWPFLQRSTPLWYYILREAAVHGTKTIREPLHKPSGPHGDTGRNQTLGPVGGRIVAEVLIGLLQEDRTSFVCQEPGWTPGRRLSDQPFGIRHLLEDAAVPVSDPRSRY